MKNILKLLLAFFIAFNIIACSSNVIDSRIKLEQLKQIKAQQQRELADKANQELEESVSKK